MFASFGVPALLESTNGLFVAADHLRILGNDAAHVEARTYDTIGEREARLAIELAKEILKATYQHKNLLSQLQALMKG